MVLTEQKTQLSRAIFDTYYNYVYAIVYRTLQGTGSREDVEECVIDVFTDVIQNLDHIQSSSLKAYLAATAHNKAVNAGYKLTNHSRRTVSLEDETISGKLTSPQDVMEDAEQMELTRKLLDCIESLGEPDSVIIIQKYYLGKNAVQIGKILHMNPVTVRSRMKRALARLKTMLTDLGISG